MNRKQRGDTMAEVVVALAVLGMILAASVAIINRSLLGVMAAVERTGVRGEVNTQVELLRYVFDRRYTDNLQTSKDILARIESNTVSADEIKDAKCTVKSKGFFLEINPDAGKITDITEVGPSKVIMKPVSSTQEKQNVVSEANIFGAPHADRLKHNEVSPSRGIWIEGIKHKSTVDNLPGYIDFYVRACWTPFGANQDASAQVLSNVRVFYKEGDL